jgi:hypothetical protein
MLGISNVRVYDLKESVVACRNAMRVEPAGYTEEEFLASLPRAVRLANSETGGGHQSFLAGIRVSFDVRYPGYWSPEFQRYHFADIVTSSSKMHRLVRMDMDRCFNKYVSEEAKEAMKRYVAGYNEAVEAGDRDEEYRRFMVLLSNCPMGVELFMRVSTNYLQLKTIYRQRRGHRLKEDWGAFCSFIEGLPYAEEFGLTDKHQKQIL